MKEKIGSLERSLEEDVARRPSVSKKKPSINLPGLEDADSADEDDPEDERDLEPTPMATADTAYSQEADDDVMDLGIALGKMRITEKLGGYARPKLAEEVGNLRMLNAREGSATDMTFYTAQRDTQGGTGGTTFR